MTNLISVLSQRNLTRLATLCLMLFAFQSCSTDDGAPRFKDAEEIDVQTSTQGVISEIEEVQPGDEYKVIDETIIDSKEASMAIVHNLDGTVDSVSFAKLAGDDSEYKNSRGLRTFLMGTLAASYFHRNFGRTRLDPGRYKNTAGFNKSKGLKGNLAGTASSRRVKVPGKGSKGYGGSRSFRSFGG